MYYASRSSNERALKAFDLPYTLSEQTYSINILLINYMAPIYESKKITLNSFDVHSSPSE